MRRLAVVAGFLPLLMSLLDAQAAGASVIVPVSILRSASASASVQNTANGQQVVDPGESPSSTNPSFTDSIGADASASLLGHSASSIASSGTVSEQDLGSGLFSVRITLFAHANASGSGCTTCSSLAQSNASLDLTFDLIAPVRLEALATIGVGLHGGVGGDLRQGSTSLASTSNPVPLGFVLGPGQYVLRGSASALALVGVPPFGGFTPISDAPLTLVMQYQVVPEPSTGALTLVGLLALARRSRSGSHGAAVGSLSNEPLSTV